MSEEKRKLFSALGKPCSLSEVAERCTPPVDVAVYLSAKTANVASEVQLVIGRPLARRVESCLPERSSAVTAASSPPPPPPLHRAP